MVNASKVINSITGSIQNEQIRTQIPVLTQANTLGAVWAVLDADADIYSAFSSALVNRIAKVNFNDNTDWRDPIREFIGGGTETPLGYFEQEIGENPLSPHNFDPNDFMAILRRYGSDTKAVYFQRNYKRYFAVTIDYDGLKEAFVSDDAFLEFIRIKRNNLKVSYELNSYNSFQELICSNFAGGAFKTKELPALATSSDIEDFTAEVNTYVDNFGYYSKDYNNYANIEGANGGYYTYTKPEDIRIIAKSDIINNYMVKSLASAFNMEMAELKARILKVPEFAFDIINTETGENLGRESTDIAFVLCDKRLFHFVKNLDKYAEQFNAGNLTTNMFHHYWNTYGINPMANCIVYYTQTADQKAIDAVANQPLCKTDVPAQITVKGTDANSATNLVTVTELKVGSLSGAGSSPDLTSTEIEGVIEALGLDYDKLTGSGTNTVADVFGSANVEAITGGYVLTVERQDVNLSTLGDDLADLAGETSGYCEFTISNAGGTKDTTAKIYFTVSPEF